MRLKIGDGFKFVFLLVLILQEVILENLEGMLLLYGFGGGVDILVLLGYQ